MIELPDDMVPNSVQIEVLDFGMTLTPASGASVLRVNRPGTRLRATIGFPPMTAESARRIWSRLQAAKREGLRMEYPLLGLSQGAPGSPVIDGALPTGTTLPLRGLTPGYALKEGYVLTLIDADGRRYTHFASSGGLASAAGEIEITIEPPIRGVFADGDTVLLARPTIEGAVVGEFGWSLATDRLVRQAEITIEESAGVSL